ncbi:MAG: hypothetical protein M3388_06940 [Acidobacteriota bacterium]|nr:hypothetical protein [Acidobacteriota bacterium]
MNEIVQKNSVARRSFVFRVRFFTRLTTGFFRGGGVRSKLLAFFRLNF